MKKYIIDFRIAVNQRLNSSYSLLKLVPVDAKMPEILPGQFVQIEVAGSKTTFLRRPVSVNFVDYEANQLWILIRDAGDGTRALINSCADNVMNMILPLGNSFSLPASKDSRLILAGGGVGVAPMLFWGDYLRRKGYKPEFLLGAKTDKDLLQIEDFSKIGQVHLSTDDGSRGEKGFIIHNSVLNDNDIDYIYCCGPLPMMKAIARIAKEKDITCQVSLENSMACGIGACLCCVENTVDGNVCVCTEGPIFNIDKLTWEI